MKTDPLQDMLSHADSAAPAPVISAGLTNRILRRARRRIIQRNATMLLAALFVCGLAFEISRRPHPAQPPARLNAARLVEIRTELARLDADAERELRLVAELQKHQALQPRLDGSFDDPMPPYALARVDEARNRTALILLREADRVAADPATRSQAGDLYLRTVQLFPATPAGRVAARRLKST
jgi:hypothetical protein